MTEWIIVEHQLVREALRHCDPEYDKMTSNPRRWLQGYKRRKSQIDNREKLDFVLHRTISFRFVQTRSIWEKLRDLHLIGGKSMDDANMAATYVFTLLEAEMSVSDAVEYMLRFG
jgi:hypothetical protein